MKMKRRVTKPNAIIGPSPEPEIALPQGPVGDILLQLSYKDLLQACQTNKAWNQVCNSDGFWKLKGERDFPGAQISSRRDYENAREEIRLWNSMFKASGLKRRLSQPPDEAQLDDLADGRYDTPDLYRLLKFYVDTRQLDKASDLLYPRTDMDDIWHEAASDGDRAVLTFLLALEPEDDFYSTHGVLTLPLLETLLDVGYDEQRLLAGLLNDLHDATYKGELVYSGGEYESLVKLLQDGTTLTDIPRYLHGTVGLLIKDAWDREDKDTILKLLSLEFE